MFFSLKTFLVDRYNSAKQNNNQNFNYIEIFKF